ncbi:MAG: caspase family protein [Thermoguttaceae bacterium]|nr:caspase family protein [Thermoguttaceae bacterium]
MSRPAIPSRDALCLALALVAPAFLALTTTLLFAQSDDDLPTVAPSKRRVFLVETDEYIDDALSPLPDAKNDLAAIRERLEELGVPPERIEEYSSRQRAALQPSKRAIEEGFQRYLDDLTKDDFAFVYLVGSGAEDADARVSYYMPMDADPENFDYCVPINGENGLTTKLGKSEARFGLVVVDAGRLSRRSEGRVARGNIPGFPRSVALLQCCEPNQNSLALRGENGIFTAKLLEALVLDNNPADADRDGILSLNEFFQYAIRETSVEARRVYGKSQTPVASGAAPSFGLLKPEKTR